jgi:hypothetical protein
VKPISGAGATTITSASASDKGSAVRNTAGPDKVRTIAVSYRFAAAMLRPRRRRAPAERRFVAASRGITARAARLIILPLPLLRVALPTWHAAQKPIIRRLPTRLKKPRRRGGPVRGNGAMCKEQMIDFLAACDGKIPWAVYQRKWGGEALAL